MERRKFSRFHVQFKVTLSFSQGEAGGEGRLVNLALGGAGIRSAKRVVTGDFVALRIFPPDTETPIAVESAAVRWVQGPEFGVEFLKVQPAERQRLEELLKQLEDASRTR